MPVTQRPEVDAIVKGAADKAAALAAEAAKGEKKKNKADDEPNIPPEMRVFWESFTADERKAIILKSKLGPIIAGAYTALKDALKALKIKATDPLIITSAGQLLDPETFNAGEPADDDDDDAEETEETDGDDDADDDDDEPFTKGEAKGIIRDLKRHLKTNNISQADAAKELGVTPAAISTWFSGNTIPRQDNLDRICVMIIDPDDADDDDAEEEAE